MRWQAMMKVAVRRLTRFSSATCQTALKASRMIFTSRSLISASLQKKHRLPLACFGHAGDGNIHVNVMHNGNDPAERSRSEECLDDLFRGILALGGAITGEHGIGLAKMPWWADAVSPEARQLHLDLKRALDPQGILNPGKFLG